MKKRDELEKKYYEMLEHTKKLEEERDAENIPHEKRMEINNILNESQYPMNALMKWVLDDN